MRLCKWVLFVYMFLWWTIVTSFNTEIWFYFYFWILNWSLIRVNFSCFKVLDFQLFIYFHLFYHFFLFKWLSLIITILKIGTFSPLTQFIWQISLFLIFLLNSRIKWTFIISPFLSLLYLIFSFNVLRLLLSLIVFSPNWRNRWWIIF